MTKKILRTRATTEAQKRERTESLISAASELFEKSDFDDISTAEIASRAGLAKGTLFLYFKTKESLFLELLALSMKDWFAESVTLLKGKRKTPQSLAHAIGTTLVARPSLIRLLALLHPVLERNSDPESLSRFKSSLLSLTSDSASLFHDILSIRIQACTRAVLWMHALIIGLAQIAIPPKVIRRTLEQQELKALRLNFEIEIEASLRALFEGVCHQGSNRKLSK